ncbi:hypothetical protein OG21DRAFT_1504840 [Imleria badia]|nr:hypothetical protein OG21DRAFT_1504840 [Imleria badia]
MSPDRSPPSDERRFQPTERSSHLSHDHFPPSPPSRSYSSSTSPNAHSAFSHQNLPSWNTTQYSALSTSSVTYPSLPPSSVSEVPSTPCSPTEVNVVRGNYVMSGSYSAYDPGQNVAHWDGHPTFDPTTGRTVWPTSPDRQPLSPLVDQESGTFHPSLDQASPYPIHPGSLYAANSNCSCSEPSVPQHSPPHQSLTPASLLFSPHPMPTGLLETDSREHHPSSHVPHQNSSGSFYRRRVRSAVEYDGACIDEEELIKGLKEPDGKLTVHQCLWEVDHSPCHLWIRGEKSAVNAHIQKWHGWQPEGDNKSRVDCRWCACGKMMLRESIARHIVNVHLGEIWECQGCGKEIARSDAYGQHAEKSEFDACQTSGALITYTTDARVIDAPIALESGRRLQYDDA